jgi:hypothetical protein
MWGVTATNGTVASVTVNFGTNNYSCNTEATDSTINTASYAYLDIVPPKYSLADEWTLVSNTNTTFVVSAPAGTIMDLDLEFVLQDVDPTLSVNYSSGSAVEGRMYYFNLWASANAFTPVALSSNY